MLLEPAFDLYYGQVRIAGGTVVPVPLQVDETGRQWTVDPERIEAAVMLRAHKAARTNGGSPLPLQASVRGLQASVREREQA